jgi:hypothetical protein
MTREQRISLKSMLAAALAEGKSCVEWGRAHGVKDRRAQEWSGEPEVRAQVESIRRANLDQAIGRMSQRVVWATDEIAELAKGARSESVKLGALRSILSDMLMALDFAGLEARIAKLEEQDRVRHQESTSCAG